MLCECQDAILAEKLIRPKIVASFKADQVEPRL